MFTVRNGAMRCGAVRCGSVRFGVVRFGAVRCGAVGGTDLFVEREVCNVAVLPEGSFQALFLVHERDAVVVERDRVPLRRVYILQRVIDVQAWSPDGVPVDFGWILRSDSGMNCPLLIRWRT